MDNSSKIQWLSIVRALGLLLVLAYHFFQASLPAGFLGVDMFFTLSGYLITAQLLGKYSGSGEFSFYTFIKRRFKRVYPPLICAILITLPFALLISQDFTAGIGRQIAASAGFTTNYFEILTGGSYENRLLPHLFVHTWTLAVEMHFYILWGALFAVIALILKRARRTNPERAAAILKWSVLSASAAIAVLMYVNMQLAYAGNTADPSAAYFGTATHGFPFLLGAAAGAVFGSRRKAGGKISAKACAAFSACGIALSAVCIAALALTQSFYSEIIYRYGILLTSLLTAAIIKCALVLNAAVGAREPRPLTLVSSMSYCVYLFHWPFYIIFSQLFSNLLAAGAALAMTFAFSALVVLFIEPRLTVPGRAPAGAADRKNVEGTKNESSSSEGRRRVFRRTAPSAFVALLFAAATVLSGIVIARAPEISALEANLRAEYLYMDADEIGDAYMSALAEHEARAAASGSTSASSGTPDGAGGATSQAPGSTSDGLAESGAPPEQASPQGPGSSASAAGDIDVPQDPDTQREPDAPQEYDAQGETEAGAPESPDGSPGAAASDSDRLAANPAASDSPDQNAALEAPGEPDASDSPEAPAASAAPATSPAPDASNPPDAAPSPAPAPPDETPEQGEPEEAQAAAIPQGVTIVGDSVCMGARRDLADAIPDCHVDVEGSRQIWQGYNILMSLQEQGRLREYVVVALGTNGNANAFDMIEQIIADVSPGHRLVFVTPYDGRATPSWFSSRAAEYMRTLPGVYSFVTVADWAETILPHARLLGSDKVHISGSPAAVELYVNCIIDALAVAAGRPAK